MHARCSYDYALIRVVPRVEREEFINAGVILSCQASGFLAAAVALDEARLLALDAGVDLHAVRRHLGAIVAICEGGPGSGHGRDLVGAPRAHFGAGPVAGHGRHA